ncbi:MAG: HD domain-containing protein [Ignavibacteriota bacterium]|nr:MAG: HD domain-containing protein [Chlorobiota bacterium]MBE7475541.1 HD domain-containing protein [Ignavibacteriales bacterium]MBL1122501.1 HD domain-containing protein [Ignavibacteriota bacterium]MCC7095232.1 HD domain-containing protein [Ignavibacteriaceae bacterium]MCE7856554.1 HD domain-containing protein [Ignavibacteria bacterium CHB3]MEB2296203.1 HD domain-containing protein [Ignavibacteria bacterium]
MKQPELKTLIKNDRVDHFLLIRRIELRSTKNDRDFLSTELGDKSTSMNANIWEGFAEIAAKGKVGDVVKVTGTIEEFQGSLQIRVSSIRLAVEKDKVFPKDFLPHSKRNPEEMKKEFNQKIKNISNKHLNKLLSEIFSGIRFELFSTAPAGKSWHHAYIHGLIEHTLEIIKICELMCEFHPELNRDLLVSGAMLHDVGKIEELAFYSAFEYTDKGKLIGHIVIASNLVRDEIKKIPGFTAELENNLIHLILSHQGKLEHASPVVPKTAEAITLYQADELSAKVNAYKNAVESELKPDSNWTKFIHLADTDLYKFNFENIPEENTKKSLFD